MRKLTISLLLVLTLASCGVKAKKVNDAEKYSNKIGYFQDETTGIVFGVLEIRKQGDPHIEGIGMTVIPKSEINQMVKEQIKNYKD